MKRIDIQPGDKYGNWTVIRELPINTRYRRKMLCRCACGAEGEVFTNNLLYGMSCGCRMCGSLRRHKKKRAAITSTPATTLWARIKAFFGFSR